MLSNRALLRAAGPAQRFVALRAPVQRRFNSSTPTPASENKVVFPDTEFARERIEVKKHARDTSELWRKLTYYVVPAIVLLGGINAYNLWTEHWEHWAHETPLEERTEYAYQNIRNKNYFWGDGDKTLFWNPNVNYHNPDKA
ncbi:Cytochrome c oxidase subunit 6A, mitochondrial [Ascosphaera pollenicola]|nr:Cytochrome c oxidase subunit 6A, mitochondrial [Ascosphaera pollenicola]